MHLVSAVFQERRFEEMLSFYRCPSRFEVFQTRVAHLVFCLVRINAIAHMYTLKSSLELIVFILEIIVCLARLFQERP